MVGAWRLAGLWASGTESAPAPSLGFHWFAPAGLLVNSHSKVKRRSKKVLSQVIGVVVHAPSSPLEIVNSPEPVPKLFFHPRPCCSMGAASGSRPTYGSGSPAPCDLPKV